MKWEEYYKTFITSLAAGAVSGLLVYASVSSAESKKPLTYLDFIVLLVFTIAMFLLVGYIITDKKKPLLSFLFRKEWWEKFLKFIIVIIPIIIGIWGICLNRYNQDCENAKGSIDILKDAMALQYEMNCTKYMNYSAENSIHLERAIRNYLNGSCSEALNDINKIDENSFCTLVPYTFHMNMDLLIWVMLLGLGLTLLLFFIISERNKHHTRSLKLSHVSKKTRTPASGKSPTPGSKRRQGPAARSSRPAAPPHRVRPASKRPRSRPRSPESSSSL